MLPLLAVVSVSHLVWNLDTKPNDRIGPTSISWTDDHGKVVWTKPIPDRLQIDVNNDSDARAWMTKQHDDGYAKYWAIVPLADAIAIETEGELIVFDAGDGHTRFEWTDTNKRTSFADALFDSGTVDVSGPDGEKCAFSVDDQNFIRACGPALIYYDRGQIAAFTIATWKLLGKERWQGPRTGDLKGKCPGMERADFDGTKSVGGWTIHAKGVRETMCET